MPHIALPDLPGIRGPMAFRPETARPLNDLVDVLLRGPSSLTPGERELIATFVSAENDCRYCQTIHGAVAALAPRPDVLLCFQTFVSGCVSGRSLGGISCPARLL